MALFHEAAFLPRLSFAPHKQESCYYIIGLEHGSIITHSSFSSLEEKNKHETSFSMTKQIHDIQMGPRTFIGVQLLN